MKWILALAALLWAANFAAAQTIFQPVQYQYGGQSPFYYGGSNPAVLAFASGWGEASWGRHDGFAFTSGTVDHFRDVSAQSLCTYSDAIPYENAAVYGYTANDARLAAYSAAPRYFCKRDLLAAAVPAADGSLIVPAHAQPLPTPRTAPSTRPAPVPVLILPKGQLLPAPKSNNVRIVRN